MQTTTATSWLSPEGLAEFLGVPRATVYRWNSEGTGPRRHRIGKHVRYARRDIDLWMDQHAEEENRSAR